MKFLMHSVFCCCFIICQIVAGSEIYNSDFASKGITGRNINGLRELVNVNDLPGASKAMRLTTISKGKKNLAPSWDSSKLKITKDGIITVDYYVKQLNMTGRYGVFVSSVSKKQLVAVIFRAGEILYYSKKQWRLAESYKLNKWYHIRYIINTECKTYDLYIENMTTPVAKNIVYRDIKAGLPTRVWLPGAVLKNAKSEYAEIKVQYKQADSFPSAQLLKSPLSLKGDVK